MTPELYLMAPFSPLMPLVSFRVGVDTDQDTSVSIPDRFLKWRGVKTGSNAFPLIRVQRRLTGLCGGIPNTRAPGPSECGTTLTTSILHTLDSMNPVSYHQGAASPHLKIISSMFRGFLHPFTGLMHLFIIKCDQALTEGCPQLPEAPPDPQRTPPHHYAACLLWTVGPVSHQPSGL